MLSVVIVLFFSYCNNTGLADPEVAGYYQRLKDTLPVLGYSDRLLVISTKRLKWHNSMQVKAAGAASRSRHLSGDAIDFLVFDINNDGRADSAVAYRLLDAVIVGNRGGVGTYQHEKAFIDRQMIHIDCRGHRARWHR